MQKNKYFVIVMLLVAQISFANVEEAFQQQQLVLISDFDETLTGPGWNTLWFLRKIPTIQSYLQLSAINSLIPGATFESLPKMLPVSGREIGEFFSERLAVIEANGKITPGSLTPQNLLPIPGTPEREHNQVVIPGLYRVTEESWERFRSSENIFYLLEDNMRAQQFERATGLSRFGRSFPLFRTLAQSRRTIDNIHIVTARAQSPLEFEKLFQVWQREGHIKNTQGQRLTLDRRLGTMGSINVYPVGEGLGLLYGNSITQRKVQLVRDQILNQYLLLGKQQKKKFTVVIAENDPLTVASYARMLQEIMGIPDYQKQFDIILLHAGTELEVSRSGLPGRWSQLSGGLFRPLQETEVTFLTGESVAPEKRKSSRKAVSCQSIF
jgi:hypothetical protein